MIEKKEKITQDRVQNPSPKEELTQVTPAENLSAVLSNPKDRYALQILSWIGLAILFLILTFTSVWLYNDWQSLKTLHKENLKLELKRDNLRESYNSGLAVYKRLLSMIKDIAELARDGNEDAAKIQNSFGFQIEGQPLPVIGNKAANAPPLKTKKTKK